MTQIFQLFGFPTKKFFVRENKKLQNKPFESCFVLPLLASFWKTLSGKVHITKGSMPNPIRFFPFGFFPGLQEGEHFQNDQCESRFVPPPFGFFSGSLSGSKHIQEGNTKLRMIYLKAVSFSLIGMTCNCFDSSSWKSAKQTQWKKSAGKGGGTGKLKPYREA